MTRRSARLASKTHEVQTPTLDSVSEHDERPNASRPRAAIYDSPAPKHHPSTPTSSAIKPPMSAMHPSKVHSTMAPPSSGLRLGFTDIRPVATKRGHELPSGIAQLTPTKVKGGSSALPSTPFTFSVSRPPVADPSLSSRAKQMMDELRGEAAKIKAELTAQRAREQADDAEAATGRKFLKPKGKSRFSAAHMAAFDKMDSIENHPSAYRAKISTPVKGITTPVKGIKRSSSRANLDEIPPSITRRSAIKRSPSKARLDEVDSPRARKLPAMSPFVRSRAAVLEAQEGNPPTPAKRFKQRLEDDASSSRPGSRDGSSIPRPKSSGNDMVGGSLSRSKSTMSLATPAKASLARAATKGPTITAVANSPSPSKSELHSLKRSATTANLNDGGTTTPARRILSPGGFQRMRSILRGQKGNADKSGSAVTLPSASASASKTPALPSVDKTLPALPGSVVTTPRRKLIKTPHSPSPLRTGSFFRSLSKSKSARLSNPIEAHFPNMGSVMAGSTKKAKDAEKAEKGPVVAYPDLSVFSGLTAPRSPAKSEKSASMPPPSVPGTFSFRSDHTINFNSESSVGFGASPGQASVRQVRSSMLAMPGSFPGTNASASTIPGPGRGTRLDTRSGNKENKSPRLKLPGISHGMSSKKRYRAATDEEDERAAKKRKNDHEQVPEGDALLAPRLLLAGKTSGASAGAGAGPSASGHQKKQQDAAAAKAACKLDAPAKKTMVPRAGVQALSRTSPQKKAVLSLSRLNMLARPKTRQQ